MIKLYEQRLGTTLSDVVYFKLAIDARCHWIQDGHVHISLSLPHFFTYCAPLLV